MMYPYRVGRPIILDCGPDTENVEWDVSTLIPANARGFFFLNPNLFTCLLRGTPTTNPPTAFMPASYGTAWHVVTGRSPIYGTLSPRALSAKTIDGPAALYLPQAKAGTGKLILQYVA